MNEEMRDSEGVFGAAGENTSPTSVHLVTEQQQTDVKAAVSTGDDETFQDIFRDFSDMASHDPERLSRRQFSRGGEEEEEEEEKGRGGGGGGGGVLNSVEKASE